MIFYSSIKPLRNMLFSVSETAVVLLSSEIYSLYFNIDFSAQI